jgi:hypothetical protein
MRTGIIALAGLALAACASTETASNDTEGSDCFRAADVNGYSIVDDRQVGITVGAGRRYVLTTLFNARDLDWTHAIAIRSSTSFICTGATPGVDLIGGDPQRRIPVTSIERAPDDEDLPTGS